MSGDYVLNTDINSFFLKGTRVTIVRYWGDSVYVKKVNGIHRVTVEKSELSKK
jgi:hypothetical protein